MTFGFPQRVSTCTLARRTGSGSHCSDADSIFKSDRDVVSMYVCLYIGVEPHIYTHTPHIRTQCTVILQEGIFNLPFYFYTHESDIITSVATMHLYEAMCWRLYPSFMYLTGCMFV